MANAKKMDYVLLGLLSHDTLSGYEMKQRMDHSLSMFWGASYGSIYPTLNQLQQAGHIRAEAVSESSRGMIRYRITDKGRERLRNWLSQPVEKDELRYETLLKLFFGGESSPSVIRDHILSFQQKSKQHLEELKEAEKILTEAEKESPTHSYYLLTVQFGIETYEGYLRWCERAEKKLKFM